MVEGEKATVSFDGHRCIHARRCVMGEPQAFKANVKGPWIDPDATDVEALMRIAHNCPSGAIHVTRKDGGANEGPPAANVVIVRENGPLAFHADLRINGEEVGFRATLCRCGLSRRKPYCDNSHIKGGFVATGEPASKETELKITDLVGAVEVQPVRNGPLMVTGKLEVESGTGRCVDRAEKTWFCRCGHSSKKPFCDGTHKAVGFQAP
ncbi:CDGSH iron-sulfur domain-containing protein [Mesorhizobium sp. BAC0120]|uniref:CDGSH iron-sulfur domain-containing protein n=1 Tax=Mesorhizobium sp. BAC0120 TaxID=3090670 RepID=UPI00298D4EE7|nr:CDGSH iron-sulfur domain-containing protein [Mesorhizobium sp. BAC0120]MDW6022698.1 CDGSH iron-sulfur domain-containing protein [Mesorhizobium sp. BAC0120]